MQTAPEDEKDVPMYQEDQDRINEFARLHMKHKQFQDRVAETKVKVHTRTPSRPCSIHTEQRKSGIYNCRDD